MAHALQQLVIGDDADSWRAAGFSVDGNHLTLGKVVVEFAGSKGQRGVLGWKLAGVEATVESIPTITGENSLPTEVKARPSNINKIFAIDHVVVESKNVDRTVAAFAEVGMVERRSATMMTPMGERRQSFLWAGRVIIEVIGPLQPEHADLDGEASIWGLALVSSNLQTTSHVLDAHLSEPKDAVQPGRKIATMRTKELDISVPIVVMSPHVAELQ